MEQNATTQTNNTVRKIKKIRMTCHACPSQWDGELVDGGYLYVRFRWGTLRVDIDGNTVFEWESGDSFDGYMSLETVQSLTSHLLDFTGAEILGEDESYWAV